MGSASHGPLLLLCGGTDLHGGGQGEMVFLDIHTIKPLEIRKSGNPGFFGHGPWACVRASADGKAFGMWHSLNVAPSGLYTFVLAGNELRQHYEHTGPGHVVPGPDGEVIYTGFGPLVPMSRMTSAGAARRVRTKRST